MNKTYKYKKPRFWNFTRNEIAHLRCCKTPTCISSVSPPYTGLTCGVCGTDCKGCKIVNGGWKAMETAEKMKTIEEIQI